ATPAACRFHAKIGPVHGDFHPRNILVGKVLVACLIDFGWATKKCHIVVDHVLMEVSIKFFYLPPCIPRQALASWARSFLTSWCESPKTGDAVLDGASKLVNLVRREAGNHLSDQADMGARTR